MMFKYRPSYKVTYEKQGLIYFTCINYSYLPQEQQHKIVNLCVNVAGEHYKAVFMAVTTKRSMQSVALEHNIDISWLCKLCKKFYESFENQPVRA